MFIDRPLLGSSLPEGTLCLTFDDGPGAPGPDGSGPRTLELAEYLSDEAVPATFFACGEPVAALPGVVERVRALGHAVGNHTHTHPDLQVALAGGLDVVSEVAATDALIRAQEGPLFFRPPYGSWSPAVAAALNTRRGLAAGYVGPVLWDIDGRDWAAWRDGRSARSCAATYRRAVESTRRGIVLMHDSTADHTEWQPRNLTFETVRLLVPELRAQGYRFAALAEIPALSPR
ncbi:MAG TPA: polysaccharide deacetylase family protein [Actinomycetes bacterium]|nr:polysaccharide deacetylase family protein [Actinomycetes bacterium]